jgi:alpha-glucosidase
MGGLISHYAVHEFSETFGKAGALSPAYWYSPDVFSHSRFKKMPLDARLYIAFINSDGDGMIADTDKMIRQLRMQGHPRAHLILNRETQAVPRTGYIRQAFKDAVVWLFAEPKT